VVTECRELGCRFRTYAENPDQALRAHHRQAHEGRKLGRGKEFLVRPHGPAPAKKP
jgi:hypothetical protein